MQSHFFVKPKFGLCMVKLWLSWGFDNNDHISASISLSEIGLQSRKVRFEFSEDKGEIQCTRRAHLNVITIVSELLVLSE